MVRAVNRGSGGSRLRGAELTAAAVDDVAEVVADVDVITEDEDELVDT